MGEDVVYVSEIQIVTVVLVHIKGFDIGAEVGSDAY